MKSLRLSNLVFFFISSLFSSSCEAASGRCVADPTSYGNCTTVARPLTCRGSSQAFCSGLQQKCTNTCRQSAGCQCIWTEEINLCRSGQGNCRWTGTCANFVDPRCFDITIQDKCAKTKGCQWKTADDAAKVPSSGASAGDLPVNLRPAGACSSRIDAIASCLEKHNHPDCLGCSLGQQGIKVPQGGFQTCSQVQGEYCKKASSGNTLAGSSYIGNCCGECEPQVIQWVNCLYGCSNSVNCSAAAKNQTSSSTLTPAKNQTLPKNQTASQTRTGPPNLRG